MISEYSRKCEHGILFLECGSNKQAPGVVGHADFWVNTPQMLTWWPPARATSISRNLLATSGSLTTSSPQNAALDTSSDCLWGSESFLLTLAQGKPCSMLKAKVCVMSPRADWCSKSPSLVGDSHRNAHFETPFSTKTMVVRTRFFVSWIRFCYGQKKSKAEASNARRSCQK